MEGKINFKIAIQDRICSKIAQISEHGKRKLYPVSEFVDTGDVTSQERPLRTTL